MDASPQTAGGADVARWRLSACDFPGCEHEPVAGAPMCHLHRRVSVSRTGSWLEAG
ncbi:hypothetical protein [Nocardioides sp. TF02-7]|uniref:hypothetical protein n=1 Tax=Nocardioides sp. TF02-7 TaxID=2917724 RepID=UPI001F0652F5|nr:hypothetical protein [Nocardioides sp. TF02-7]UMG92487.1 hypothetical protein MF408_22065 [Nocardioides sp. TF02-7]